MYRATSGIDRTGGAGSASMTHCRSGKREAENGAVFAFNTTGLVTLFHNEETISGMHLI